MRSGSKSFREEENIEKAWIEDALMTNSYLFGAWDEGIRHEPLTDIKRRINAESIKGLEDKLSVILKGHYELYSIRHALL